MPQLIQVKIDVLKIDKAALYKGKKGTYLTLAVMPNKGGEDQYGNTHYITQDLGRDRRDAGERGPILGNGTLKTFGGGGGGYKKKAAPSKYDSPPKQEEQFPFDDDIPDEGEFPF